MEGRFVVIIVSRSRGTFQNSCFHRRTRWWAKFFGTTAMIGGIFQENAIPLWLATSFVRRVWRDRRVGVNAPSTPRSWLRLLSNMSTGLDVEKLSLGDSDVSFSELATRCWRSDHLYSPLVVWVFRWSILLLH